MENVFDFYLMATVLKYIKRSGWDSKHWNIKGERVESIAEHIYGTCILAIAMESEFEFDIDLNKVLRMLILHELEEVIIGDITPLDNISESEKLLRGHQAIKKVLAPLKKKDMYINLIIEFDEHKTNESIFAYHCDKMEANLQAKYYQDNGCVDDILELEIFNHSRIKNVYEENDNMFDIWYKNDYKKFEDDENFKELFNALKNKNMKK